MSESNGHTNGSQAQGGGGALFARSDNIRSDAHLAARMISIGVIEMEQAKALLVAGFTLADKMAKKEDARGYAACMKIALEVAKLEQTERHKAIDKRFPDLVAMTSFQADSRQAILDDPEYLAYREQKRLGIIHDATTPRHENGPHNGSANGNGHHE